MDSERLRRQAENLLLRADELEGREAAAELLVEELNEWEGEIVIFFKKRFNDDRTYTYAAVRYGLELREIGSNDYNGGRFIPGGNYWATTGPKSPKNITTEQLVNWMLGHNGVTELWIACDWEPLI